MKIKSYKIGSIYTEYSLEPHILAQVAYSKVALISLETGNRHTDPVEVKNVNKITAKEFKQLMGFCGNFKFAANSLGEYLQK